MIRGIGASPGIAVGAAWVIKQEERTIDRSALASDAQAASEGIRFQQALAQALAETEALVARLQEKGREEQADIIDGQVMLLCDPQLSGDVLGRIAEALIGAEAAVDAVFRQYEATFEAMDDEYLRARAADFRDARERLLDMLTGLQAGGEPAGDATWIWVASDIGPSVTARLDPSRVLAIVTDTGSRTSHSAIMARSLGIPAVVGCRNAAALIGSGDKLIVDGEAGIVIASPDTATIAHYERMLEEQEQRRLSRAALRDRPAVTTDGVAVELFGNIGSPEEASAVVEQGGEGVGLFRTEFLYMGRTKPPSEDEQLAAYRKAVELLAGRPLIVRTLDVGGDKPIDYLGIQAENNPFLGFRAIRYCLEHPELFKTQLRAVLRAGSYGPVRIMFPMIARLDELERAKELLDEAKEELRAEKLSFDDALQVGIMVEIPAAALAADLFAPHIDFFSIGTNDLIQYTMAADRMNERVGYLYDPGHVAVLRLVEMVCRAAEKHGRLVAMCGEMAGDPAYTPVLLGLGVREFSMSAVQIPAVKEQIVSVSAAASRQQALCMI